MINAQHIYEFCRAEAFWMEGLELENQWRYLRSNFSDAEARTLAEGLAKWRDTRPALLAQLFPHLPPEELQAAVEQMDEAKEDRICHPGLTQKSNTCVKTTTKCAMPILPHI